MSLESFYHEVALRKATADRDQLKFTPPWWRRCLAALSPTVKRILILAGCTALTAAGWNLYPHIAQNVLAISPHPSSAADILATSNHHASPTERAHRLVLACARENDARACQEAIRHALTLANTPVVASWLKEKEVHALRVNAYFDRFAARLEPRFDQKNQASPPPTHTVLPQPQPRAPDARTMPAIHPSAVPVASQSLNNNDLAIPGKTPDSNPAGFPGTSDLGQTGTTMSPHASLDVSSARALNPTDAVNANPAKPVVLSAPLQ